MKNLFFYSNDSLSDVRVFGEKVFLYQSNGKEYHHATVDPDTAKNLEAIHGCDSLTSDQKTNICRALYAKDEFVVSRAGDSGCTYYSQGSNVFVLSAVKTHIRNGRKIEAIKTLRNMYTPKLGLKEAKELVEAMES